MLVQQNFVETKLATKFAEFNLRVYADNSEKETIVLWTEHLDLSQPVLVRVHSECITGDTLGSLHCDCGKQFIKSLQLIGEEGGIFIYLRQEGRGIGLLEKIKSYQLQSKGYDTFEANVLLGHHPDKRSYEIVKTILDDLHVSNIKLLTNNPSKVSDIAKLGIKIVECVPLLSKPNKHNKVYLETKRKKFHHFLGKTARHYFYQFPADSPQQVESILEFINHKKTDPLLKICVGITANHHSLKEEKEIERIHSIIQVCHSHEDLIPVLHFSFRNSPDIWKDIVEIKHTWPSLSRLQLNDIDSLQLVTLRKISDLFSVDIPLSDANFDLVNHRPFRELVRKNNSFIVLDNSKGRGLKEPKEALMRKVDTLLTYGLNDITFCGGFGPDELDTYFDIRRYYRINFSIDAETKLKTDGKVDVDKVKLYLSQLFRFDDPKYQGIEQTRKFLAECRRSDWDKVYINGSEFLIHPLVFHAGYFPSTSWFAKEVCDLVKNDSSFCEVGCGSGIIACLAAHSNLNLKVVATDINPYASENTKKNAEDLGISTRVSVFTGDVLDSIDPKLSFDSIFWALPFGFLDPGTEISLEETQVFDPGYRAIRKFFQTAKHYLKPTGRLLIGFSSDLGHVDLLKELATEAGITLTQLKEKTMKEEVEIKFEILEGRLDVFGQP